jgi:hypothetical protein
MDPRSMSCPLPQRRLIELYFLDSRTKLLEIAAFLDRMDRSESKDSRDDFRVEALREALKALCSPEPGRVERVQMILSDRTIDPLNERDRQSAFGAAFDSMRKEAE